MMFYHISEPGHVMRVRSQFPQQEEVNNSLLLGTGYFQYLVHSDIFLNNDHRVSIKKAVTFQLYSWFVP